MKRAAYHRLAAAELIESARFYDQRRPGLGDEFISAVEAVQELIRSQPQLGRRGLLDTFSFRTKRFPFRIVYELARPHLDCRGGAFESPTRVLGATVGVSLRLHSALRVSPSLSRRNPMNADSLPKENSPPLLPVGRDAL